MMSMELLLSYFRSLYCWGLLLGLMAFISSRIWLTSFVPTWWSNQTNSVVIAIGFIAAMDSIASGKLIKINFIICIGK